MNMNTTTESSITDVVVADCNSASKKQHSNPPIDSERLTVTSVTTSKPVFKDDENEKLKEMLKDPNSDKNGDMTNNSTVSSISDKEQEFVNKRIAKKFSVLSSNKIHQKNNGRVNRVYFGMVEKPVAGKLWKIIFDDCDEDILSHVDLLNALKLYDQYKEYDKKSNPLSMRPDEELDSIDAASTSRKYGKKKTKVSPKRGKQSYSPKVPRAEPEPVWSGPPADEELEGGWPKGWVKKVFARKKGTTKDRYWYTPNQKYKLRSMVEVKRFLAAVTKTKGDEVKAKTMVAKK